MKKWPTILLFLVVILVGHQASSQEDSAQKKAPPFSLKGYLKYLSQASTSNGANQLLTNQLIHNRLNFRYQPNDHLNFRLEIRNRIYYGDLVRNYPGFADLVTSSNASLDLSKNWVNAHGLLINSTIDRANAEYLNGKWDITLGRQRINWGINTVWTPNDIFNTFNYFDFDYEERPGTDAARIQYNLNNSSSLELAASPGKTQRQQIGALMYHLNKWNYDFQVFTGIYQQDISMGAGWAGNIKGAGFKGELTYFSPYGPYKDSAAFVSSLSIDYGFKNGLYLLVSGLYNSLGKDSLTSITQLTSAALSAKNIFPFRYTAFAELSYSFTPILKASLAFMYSPTANTIILLPTVTYSVANNWVLDLIAQSFYSQQNGSYGILGNSIYLRLKWGF